LEFQDYNGYKVLLIKKILGLRKTMLRAHRQAWCWQDEWFGLQISDIRRLELETQKALAEKMGVVADNEDEKSYLLIQV
jgi:hypothetical protein